MAMQVDRQARMALIIGPRRQHDLIDQLADQVRRLNARQLIAQRRAKRSGAPTSPGCPAPGGNP